MSLTGGNGHFAGVGLNKVMNHLQPRLAGRWTFIEAEQPIGQIAKLDYNVPAVARTRPGAYT